MGCGAVIFMICALLVLMGVVFVLYHVLFKIDASSMAIDPALTPEAQIHGYEHRHPTVLITYAHGPRVFLKNQNALTQSAIGKGFDVFENYRQGHLDPSFYAKFKETLDQPRGAGYWLWKPYLILEAMKKYPENTFVTYADSGIVFSKSMAPLFDLLEETPIILAGNNSPASIRTYLKMEARTLLKIAPDDPRLDFTKVWAPFMVFKNTPRARAFVQEWFDLCQIKDVLTDAPFDEEIQDEVFIRHLHDEVLISLVMAKKPHGIRVFSRKTLHKKYGVVNFHRHPAQEFSSPLFISAGVGKWVSNILFNTKIVQILRKRFY